MPNGFTSSSFAGLLAVSSQPFPWTIRYFIRNMHALACIFTEGGRCLFLHPGIPASQQSGLAGLECIFYIGSEIISVSLGIIFGIPQKFRIAEAEFHVQIVRKIKSDGQFVLPFRKGAGKR